MKKITLALFALVGSATAVFSQANTTLQAPQTDGSWSTLHAPSGSASAVYHRACYLVKQSELGGLALTNSVITGFGFDFLNGVSTAVTGQFTVYLQNTSDATYLKGPNFPTAIAPMQTNYVGNYSIPVSPNGTASIVLPLTTSFTYTGGGIYVAFEWFCASPNSSTPARYNCNTTGLTPTGGGYTFTAVGPAPTTMSLDVFRPAFLFRAANTATNELSVTKMEAMGKYSKLLTGGQFVTAEIRNSSNIAKTNVPVTFSVSGANPFSITQTLATIGAGSVTTVTFGPYNTPATGLSNMSVTIPADQVNTNNLWAWSQTVTCNDFATIPPLPITSFGSSIGFVAAGGIYSWKMTPPSASSLNSIYFALAATGTFTDNMYAVLMDAGGNILASSNTITLNASLNGSFVNFDFNPPVSLTAGTAYLFGVAQPAAPVQYSPFTRVLASYPVPNFYISPIAGGSASNVDRGYMGIGAVLGFSNTNISAISSKSAVCNNVAPNTYPQSVTLTAVGLPGMTYTWTAPSSPTAASTVVTPSVTSPSGAGSISYFVTGTDGTSGCKTNSAKVTIILNKCTGISKNENFGSDINVYPNPVTNGVSSLSGLVGANTISVYNLIGQNVMTEVVNAETVNLDFSNLPTGNYFVKVTDTNNDSKIIKVLNQK